MTFLRFFVLLLVVSPSFAQKPAGGGKGAVPPELAEARKRMLHGNYEEARTGYEAAVKKNATLAPWAAIGTAQSWRWEGDPAKALGVLDAAKKAAPENPDVLATRADLLFELGKWDDAEKDADAALAKKENQLLARWTKGRLQRDRGDTDEADKTFRWAVRHYTARSNADDDIENPEELLMVALCGAENARWHNLSKQFAFILNEVLKDALKFDPDYWPAEMLAGELLLEKYNRPDAMDAFDKVLKINPKTVEPLTGKGRAALAKFELKDAEAFADQALAKQPAHPGALKLKADVHMVSGEYAAAETKLRAALKAAPRDEAAIGKLAAALFVQNKKADAEALANHAASFDAKPGLFHAEMAAALDDRKRFPEAEAHYKSAIDLRPLLPGPRIGLGMLHLRMGNEAEGRKLLETAFKADPFNVKVANSRKVMNHLDGYRTLATAHYDLKFDAATDAILAEFLADYLEETHAQLKRQYGYEPPGRTLVELFNSHEMFSGRTVGVPDLHTIGACTGRVVTIASPKAKGLAKPFNWGRVVRHELTHVFNLAQSDFQVPHWLTEGLATRNEGSRRPSAWSQLLKERHAAGMLYDLDTVLMGFARPKTPDDWTLAYCQSRIYVEYLSATYGEPALGKMLAAYKSGLDTAGALRQACSIEKAVFEKGYRVWLDGIVKDIPGARKPAKPMSFDELKKAVEADPDDLDSKGRLAEQYLRLNKSTEARKLAEEVWKIKPGQPSAALVLAKLLMTGEDKDPEAAKALVQRGIDAAPDDARLYASLGRICLEAKEFGEAAKAFENGRGAGPNEAEWAPLLAKAYRGANDEAKLAPLLEDAVADDADDLASRLQLAKIHAAARKHAPAEAMAREVLFIDATNTEGKDLLIDALKAQGKAAEAEKIAKRYAK